MSKRSEEPTPAEAALAGLLTTGFFWAIVIAWAESLNNF